MPDTTLLSQPMPLEQAGFFPSQDGLGALRARFSYYIPILGYHRVGEGRNDHVPTLSAEAFSKQLEFLKRARYSVLDPWQLAERIEQGKTLPRRSTAITFDDGYTETWTVAWPILKRFGFPATVFLTPSELELPGFMSWNQAIAAAQDGLVVGCHTMNHSYLPFVAEDRLEHELAESKAALENRIGKTVDFLSYPVGGFTRQAQAVARRAGYRLAFTTNRHSFTHRVDPFALRRIKITDRDRNGLVFRAKLSGYYDCFRQLRPPA